MAASKESSADVASIDGDKVVVVIDPLDPAKLVQRRRLVLTPDCPILPIGRSSKVHSKGFIPASDNAWFDNPVMSRNHAEIMANFNEKPVSVYLKDFDSLHGTFRRNGQKDVQLPPNQAVKLNDDDVILFGIDIMRADKSYPPCSVRFKMGTSTTKFDGVSRRCGFALPDEFDDEEDEHAEDPASKETPTVSESKGALPINDSRKPFVDLTLDDESASYNTPVKDFVVKHRNTNSDVIDLTSEANCTSNERPSPAVEAAVHTPSLLKLPSDASTLQPRASLTHTTKERLGGLTFTVASDDEAMFSKYHDNLDDEDNESEVSHDSGLLSDMSPSPPSDMNTRSESRISDLDSTLSEIENEIEYRYRLKESGGDLRFYHFLDGSDTSSANNKDYDENENDEEEDDSYEDDEDEDEENEEDESDDDASTESSSDQLSQSEAMTFADFMCIVPPVAVFGPANVLHSSYNRHPSPSDAALIKCNRPVLDNLPNDNRAQQLGEKTGKFEFFAAREQNRAAISHHHAPAPISAIRETLQTTQSNVVVPEQDLRSSSPTLSCVPDEDCDHSYLSPENHTKPKATQAETAIKGGDLAQCTTEAADVMSIKLGDTDTNQYSAWAVSGDEFINNPPTEEPSSSQTISFQTGEFDMTSAYKFQQSKQITTVLPSGETRRLLIQDLLDGEPKPSIDENSQESNVTAPPASETGTKSRMSLSFAPTKRSYEDAFKQDDNNIASSSSQPHTAKDYPEISRGKTDIPASQIKVSAQNIIDTESQDVPVVVSSHVETLRPAKRVKLAAAVKVAAYVALGGAATFSYLVSTAPVF